jgi:hypothetical protein
VSFYVRHRFGGNDRDVPLESLDELLREVDEDPFDAEHTSVSVVHESDWCVAVYAGWRVTFENVEDMDVEPRHIDAGPDREFVLRLLRATAEGDLDLLERQSWQPGYGPAGD